MLHCWNIFLTLLVLRASYGQEDPEVDITYGPVRGRAIQLSSGVVINSYLGVPYSKPPIGDLRFEAAQAPDPWAVPFEAFEPGNACIQSGTALVNSSHNGWTRYSEDCLHVNIYTPEGASNLPVMVFFHGGGYQEGANFQHPGYFMAEKDVVFLSVNYRLGILGFAYTGDSTVPGNVGLLDIIQALTFIQENIGAFGGDPSRVTISGQSAGGASVGLLLMSPLAEGLFHGAILQSGTEFNYWSYLEPETNPEKYIFMVADSFGCPSESGEEVINCLRQIDAETLIKATFNCTPGYICVGFQPVVDGVVLPDTPLNLRNSGNYNQVPEMIGVTKDEYSFFLPLSFPGIGTDGLNRTDFDNYLFNRIWYSSQKLPSMERVEDVFQAFRFYYADWPYFDDPLRNRDMIAQVLTDEGYGYAGDMQAKFHSNDGLDVFFYVYDYRMSNIVLPEWMGTIHGTDVMPQFGWPFMEDNEAALFHSQANPMFGIFNHTVLDKEFSLFFTTLWTNFAKYGNPTPEPVIGPDGTSITWLPFLPPNDQLNYLLLRESPTLLRDYRQKNYAFWTEYINYLFYGNS